MSSLANILIDKAELLDFTSFVNDRESQYSEYFKKAMDYDYCLIVPMHNFFEICDRIRTERIELSYEDVLNAYIKLDQGLYSNELIEYSVDFINNCLIDFPFTQGPVNVSENLIERITDKYNAIKF